MPRKSCFTKAAGCHSKPAASCTHGWKVPGAVESCALPSRIGFFSVDRKKHQVSLGRMFNFCEYRIVLISAVTPVKPHLLKKPTFLGGEHSSAV